MSVKGHSALIIIFLGVALVSKVDWGPAVRSCGMTPPPQPTIREESCPFLRCYPDGFCADSSPPNDGFLRKVPVPITKPGNLLGLPAEFFEVTAYAVGDKFTPGSITADGREVRPGITAACPLYMPLGTAIYVEGIGVRICEDRGWGPSDWIDIAFVSVESANMFGKQRLAVAIIH